MVASHLPSRGPKRGRNCHVTPAFSGVPNTKRREEIRSGCLTPGLLGAQKRAELLRGPRMHGGSQRQARGGNETWLPHPCLLGGPKVGGIAMQPLHSWGYPTPSARRKSKVVVSPLHSRGPKRVRYCYVYVTHALSGVPNGKHAEEIRNGRLTPDCLGPKRGRNCYVTPACMEVPNAKRREEIRKSCLTPAFSGAQKRGVLLCNPCILGDPQRQAQGENQKWLPHPCLLKGPKEGGLAARPVHSRGCLTPSTGRKSEVAALPLPCGGPKEGGIAMQPLHSWGSPTPSAGGNQNNLPHPCLLRSPKEGRIAT